MARINKVLRKVTPKSPQVKKAKEDFGAKGAPPILVNVRTLSETRTSSTDEGANKRTGIGVAVNRQLVIGSHHRSPK